MADVMDLFKSVILVQLFYAVSISILLYSMPAGALNYVTGFSDITDTINLETVGQQVESSLSSQTDIPVVELGALVFYSGNILIDLLLNFAYAIPQMIGMFINGIMLLINIDSQLFAYVELFLGVLITVLYVIGIIQLLTGIRSGRVV